MTKSDWEIMEILEAFDLTRCARSAGVLAAVDPKTVARYVEVRDAGGNPFVRARRPRLIDPFLEKIEELVDRSKGEVRADVVHGRIVVMGFAATPARPAVRWPRPRRCGGPGIVAAIGRGCPSRACGASSIGVTGP